MSRNSRTLLVLGLALAVAAAASFMVYRAVQNIPVREVEVQSYFVAVAARPLPLGTMLTTADVKLVAWPASAQVGGGFTKVEEVVNRGLIDSVAENEPITAQQARAGRLGSRSAADDYRGHAGDFGPGERGRRRGGFVAPGTFVDIILTMTRQQDDPISRIVLSNIQVLTAGTRIDQEQAKDGRAQPSTVVTLLVTPENAEKIALAGSVGHHHADAPQPAGSGNDRNQRHTRGRPDGSAGAPARREDRQRRSSCRREAERGASPRAIHLQRGDDPRCETDRGGREVMVRSPSTARTCSGDCRRSACSRCPAASRKRLNAQNQEMPERVLLTAGRSTGAHHRLRHHADRDHRPGYRGRCGRPPARSPRRWQGRRHRQPHRVGRQPNAGTSTSSSIAASRRFSRIFRRCSRARTSMSGLLMSS